MSMVTITVDHRERGSGVPEALSHLGGLEVRIATLWYGDYSLAGAVGIERKTGSDFAASVIDGRLFRQAGGLCRTYERPLIIMEGLRPSVPSLGVPWPQLRGALVS